MTSLTEQQRKAVEAIDKHVLVCAGAGSGKTHVLIERFIEILRNNEQASVSHLVAVTFTRKAATEMRNRLKSKFRDLAASAASAAGDASIAGDADGHSDRWLKCLGEVDAARIGTIHSLCEFIIKSFPVEAGIDPQFEVLDELGQAEMLSASIDQAFREVIASEATEQTLFEDFDLDTIRQIVSQSIQGSSRFLESLQNFPLADEQSLANHMQERILRARKICLTQLKESPEWRQNIPLLQSATLSSGNKLEVFKKELLECAQNIDNLPDQSQGNDFHQVWASLCTIAEQTPRSTGGPEGKPVRDLMKGVRDLCKSFAEKISPALAPSDQDGLRCIAGLVALIERTMEIYKQQKRADLLLDFNDLIALAFSALKAENSSALRFFRENTDTLLVDEFQDTNTVQSDLLALLAGDKSKFFLIGDDKQSIYRFQGADVSTFNNWRHRFNQSEDSLTLSLSESFRSHPQLVAFVNIIFAALMTESAGESHRAVFERLKAARSDEDDGRVEMIVCQPDLEASPNDPDATRRLEAGAVADWISQKIEQKGTIYDKHRGVHRPIELGDFAVLVPRNSDFAYFERAMSDRSMPFVVVSGKGYLERQEIFDLENLLRFLAAPRDNHALLAALRSPMFAVSDDLLHKIAVEGGRHSSDSLWKKVRGLGSAASTVVSRAVALLERFLLQSKLLPLSALVRSIIVETHYDLLLLSVPNGLQRSRNLWKLVALAAQKEELSCGEFAEILSRMRTVGVKLSDAPTDAADAVKLMTIHASKGLEFPFVALPVLSARNAAKKDRFLFHKEYGLAFNTARHEDDPVPTWVQACKILDEDMELAEKKRLFYVAMTRARDSLGLFVQSDGGDKNTFKSWLLEGLQLENEDLYADGVTKIVRRGCDQASIIIRQHGSESVRENLEIEPSVNADGVRHLLSRFNQVTATTNTDVAAVPQGSPTAVDSLPQISDIQGGVAVFADASGQMKFLFAEDEASVNDEAFVNDASGNDATSGNDEAGHGMVSVNDETGHGMASVNDETSGNDGTSVNDEASGSLIAPLSSEHSALPSSWQGCERVTAVDGTPVFSATVLGTFFHSLMENISANGRLMTQGEVESIAFAQHAVIPLPANIQTLVQHGLQLLEKFYESSFYKVFIAAKRRLHELPYLYNTADGVTHSRRPDLILEQEEGNWLLVDYKTDHFEPSQLSKHSAEHGKQLVTYVAELNELLGIRLSAAIYYAQYGLLQEFPGTTQFSPIDF